MSKNNENILAPKLRFPEFKKDGIWKEKVFHQLFEFGNGKDYKHLSSGNIPVYGTGGKMLSVNDYLYEGESVCIGRKGTIDNPMFLTGKFWTVDTLFYTHSFQNCIPKFIYYVFLTINWYDYNEAGGVPSLSKTTISKIKTLVPPAIQEQHKITSCLSSLDEVITAERKKLEVLKEHKKGLLQNLFPQEGETVPKVRFKEFEDSGDWVEKSFEELFEIGNGRDYKHLGNGNIPVYGSGGYMLSVNEFLYNGESVCIGRKGTIDKPMFLNGKFWTVDTLFYTHSFKNCFPKYIFYVFEGINWREHNEAGGVPSLSKTNIYKIKVLVPPNDGIAEQQKIASVLSSIDELIIAQGQKLEALSLHKKGLLQGLFPTIDNEA
jgi:type I restriction enzyme, S subunit